MIRIAVLFALLGGWISASFAADVYYVKDIELPPIKSEELLSVTLDSDVYTHSQTNYHDLRLLNSKNKEVAYLVRRGQTKQKRIIKRIWDAENVSLKPLEDDSLKITFTRDTEKQPYPPQAIVLRTPLSNFEHRVKVESSTHGHNWVTLVEDELIFDYSQFMDVRNITIDLPKIDDQPRFFRLTIADVTQEQRSQIMELSRSLVGNKEVSRTERTAINRQPFRIDGIRMWADCAQDDVLADRKEEYPIKLADIEQDAETNQTIISIESHGEPITEVTIHTPDHNFSREATIDTPYTDVNMLGSWQHLTNMYIERIDFRTLKRELLTFKFPETRATEYRIVIDNRDSPPLDITGVTAEGHEYEVLFLADPQEKYRLAYGDTRLSSPNYDTAALAESLKAGFAALVGTLGTATQVEIPPEAIVPESFFKWFVNSSLAMTTVICVLVVVLAMALYRATRHLDDIKESP